MCDFKLPTGGSGKVTRRSTGNKSWECRFCRKRSHGSDVVRRHYKSCPSRGTEPVPSPLKKGRRKRACDVCAKSKLSCDLELPCESCLASRSQCTYARVSEETCQLAVPSRDNSQSRDIMTTLPNILQQEPQHHVKNSISFLLNYANPETRTLTDAFGYSTVLETDNSETTDVVSLGYSHGSYLSTHNHSQSLTDAAVADLSSVFQIMPFNIFDVGSFSQTATFMDALLPGCFYPIDDGNQNQFEYLSGGPIEDQAWFEEPLFDLSGLGRGLTNGLCDHLTELCLSLPNDHPQYFPNTNLVSGMTLLAPANIQKFIGIYFHHWHRHSPVVHRGTFDASKVSLPLLLMVVLTGALFSLSHDDVVMARNMLDLAEECAFRNPIFVKLVSGNLPDQSLESNIALEAVQAAFSIAQIQLREGSLSKRKHARLRLFADVIKAARTISLPSTKDPFFHHPAELSDAFQWNAFSQAEAKIRLMCGIFNLDASFTIFYNMPPRLYFQELTIDMPCSLDSYLAPTSSDCHEAALGESRPHPNQLAKLVATFLEDHWGVEIHKAMKGLSVLHLFSIILALVQIIWVSRHHPSQGAIIQSIQRALIRWKAQWDFQLCDMTPLQIDKAGFSKNAAIEFWHLANILVGQSRNGIEATFEVESSLEADDLGHVNALLQRVEKLNS